MAYTFDVTAWMPAGMSDDEKDAWAAAFPDAAHMAAGRAWESWAASLAASGDSSVYVAVGSVNTGAQSVTYGSGGMSEYEHAKATAAWHYARVPSLAVRSVDYPPPANPPTPLSMVLPPTWVEYRTYWAGYPAGTTWPAEFMGG